jgi:uncharacterized phage protein (TIGR01671 family)
MNREIKFRVWDNKDRKMLPVRELTFTPGGRLLIDTGQQSASVTDMRPLELMQYTGLRDKNGVEIYEGDIVVRSRFDKPKQFSILYSEDHAAFRLKSHQFRGASYPMEQYPEGFLEVIGNIYENPELTKEQPDHAE